MSPSTIRISGSYKFRAKFAWAFIRFGFALLNPLNKGSLLSIEVDKSPVEDDYFVEF
jgi:hypothetical protein